MAFPIKPIQPNPSHQVTPAGGGESAKQSTGLATSGSTAQTPFPSGPVGPPAISSPTTLLEPSPKAGGVPVTGAASLTGRRVEILDVRLDLAGNLGVQPVVGLSARDLQPPADPAAYLGATVQAVVSGRQIRIVLTPQNESMGQVPGGELGQQWTQMRQFPGFAGELSGITPVPGDEYEVVVVGPAGEQLFSGVRAFQQPGIDQTMFPPRP